MNYFQKCEFGLESANSITNDNEIDKEFEILVTQLREDDEITIEDFVKSDNIDWSKNTDLIDWQQEVREEAIREVIPDTSSASSQAVNIVSNDDDDQEENNLLAARRTLLHPHQKHFNTLMIYLIFP